MTPHQFNLQIKGYSKRNDSKWRLMAAQTANNVNYMVKNVLSGFNGDRYKPLKLDDLIITEKKKRSFSEFDDVQEIYEWVDKQKGEVV